MRHDRAAPAECPTSIPPTRTLASRGRGPFHSSRRNVNADDRADSTASAASALCAAAPPAVEPSRDGSDRGGLVDGVCTSGEPAAEKPGDTIVGRPAAAGGAALPFSPASPP